MSACEILHFPDPHTVPDGLWERITQFLDAYLSEGTVTMPPSVYRGASSWTLLVEDGEIGGFSAHRVFEWPAFRLVQIMGMFLKPHLRNGRAAISVQYPFLRTSLVTPRKALLWCTRTRVPAAYAAATRMGTVFPSIASPDLNSRLGDWASEIARKVYGPHVSLEPRTFVMKDSYPPGSTFLTPSPRNMQSALVRFFRNNIDYSRNETVLVLASVTEAVLVDGFVGVLGSGRAVVVESDGASLSCSML